MITAKQKETFYIENTINQISKTIVSDKYITELISNNENLKSLLRQFQHESPVGQLLLSREISELLENHSISSPEISGISVITTMPCEFRYQSIYSLDHFIGSELYDCFSIDGITLFDKFSGDSSFPGLLNLPDIPNKEKLSFICPLIMENTDYNWYVCVNTSKEYIYTKYLQTQDNDEYFILNNHGEILFSQRLDSIGSLFSDETISEMVFYKKANSKILSYKNKSYLVSCSQTNDYGWKLFSLKPLSEVNTWRFMLISGTFLLSLLFIYICFKFSTVFAKIISTPLTTLSEAMQTASTIDCKNIPGDEMLALYNNYNDLINNQTLLISEIQSQQKKTVEAEIRALISQINPHFLYNTLNVISWKALDANRPDICTILSKLGKLCQHNYKFKSTFCSLQDEITSISLYMDLQKECFNNSFDYSIECSDEARNLMIPKFILQPIIENSIIHGFSQKIVDGKISVSVSTDTELIITVKDNGAGIENDTLEKLNDGNYFSEKYGIRNIDERIKLSCGQKYGLNFTSHTLMGTQVIITLPKIFQED